VTGRDLAGEIGFAARELRAPVIGQVFAEMADRARAEGWSHEEYLAAVLSRETSSRNANSVKNRLRAARFPNVKTLDDFDLAAVRKAPAELIAHLATGTWVAKADNVILLGPPGVGKTHLAIALGRKACEHGWKTVFDTAVGWAARLGDAHRYDRLGQELRRLDRYRLLVIDELGYLPFDPQQASLFFQLVAHRYERQSILITSNLSFARWGETLGDEIVAAATIDRLVHHAHVVAIDADSYRTRGRQAAPARKDPA